MPITIRFEGFVGDELTPRIVSEKLDSLDGEDIVVNLNTRGGDVYEGAEIHNRIAQYSGKKTVILGGIVASIGTFISCAFDVIKAQDTSAYMIHKAQGFSFGDSEVMLKEAEELKKLDSHIAKLLAKRSGKTEEEVLDLMIKESWYYGEEIVKNGFADELIETGKQPESKENILNGIKSAKNKYLKRVASLTKQEVTDNVDDSIKKITKEEIRSMDKAELLKRLNTLKENGDITLLEIAESLGLKDQLATNEMRKATGIMNRLTEAGVKDIEQEFDRLKKKEKEGEQAIKDNLLSENYGPVQFEDGRVNEVRRYAEQRFTGKASIEEINKDPVMVTLKAASADYSSMQNRILAKEKTAGQDNNADNKVEVVEY